MDYVNHAFENETVVLDDNTFRDCTFRDVLFQYSGGDVEISGCNMDRFSFQFGGNLAQGLHVLYQLFGTEAMLTILRGFVDPKPGDVEIYPG